MLFSDLFKYLVWLSDGIERSGLLESDKLYLIDQINNEVLCPLCHMVIESLDDGSSMEDLPMVGSSDPVDPYETDPCAECYPRSEEGCAKCGLGLVGGDSFG